MNFIDISERIYMKKFGRTTGRPALATKESTE